MNKVMSGYFDDAHRGLMRQQPSEQRSVGLAPSSSSVQLPPLRPEGSAAKLASLGLEGEGYPGAGDQKSFLQPSASLGSLEFSQDQISRGVLQDRCQQSLQDNSKLAKRIRSLQEQLAITSAKKEAFRAQAQRLEKEFRKGREQSESLQRELLDAQRRVSDLTKENTEAAQIVAEMRKCHIHEVRLLQRGLAASKGDKESRNKVNETADLVDKLGRAVVQRDEAMRDNARAQAQLRKSTADLQAVTTDCTGLKKQNKSLQAKLKEALRKAQYKPPKVEDDQPEDSDEEFEAELSAFERRFQILEEGPAGLDVLASNLSRDKRELEKKVREQQEAVKALSNQCDSWKATCAEKDMQIQDMSQQMDKMMREQAREAELVAQKRREIELKVQEEKEAMEKRIRELELEADNAREAADGMEKASTRLTQELVKVHETYNRPSVPQAPASPQAAPAQQAASPTEPPAAAPPSELASPARAAEEAAGAKPPPAQAPAVEPAPGQPATAADPAPAEPAPAEPGPDEQAPTQPPAAEPTAEPASAPAEAAAAAPPPAPAPVAPEPTAEPAAAPAAAAASESAPPPAAEPAPPTPGALATVEQAAKTGEQLRMEVFEAGGGFELSARELPDGPETRLPLSKELLDELDQKDRWTDLFSRVGVSTGPPRTVVVSQLVAAQSEQELPPGPSSVLLSAYRYDARRYFVAGVELETGRPCSVTLLEDQIPVDFAETIDACPDGEAMVDTLASLLSYDPASGSLIVG